MGRKRKNGRVYMKGRRYYGDFRDLGGKLEALIDHEREEKYATTDADRAAELASARVKELEGERRGIRLFGRAREETLGRYAAHHLTEKAKAGKVTERHLAEAEKRLTRAIEFLGSGKPLAGIGTDDVAAWTEWLGQRSGGRNGNATLSPGTVRHHLNDLSNLYKRAQSESVVPPGFNPVAALLDKPTARAEESRWLEPHEAALLLEAARTYQPEREDMAIPLHAIVATFLLTGGRASEVLGLAIGDVNFERRTVTIRPHPWRRLKTGNARRVVPLWPQLETILRQYLDDAEAKIKAEAEAQGKDVPRRVLLFPSAHRRVRADEQPITDLRGALDEIAAAAGWAKGEVRTKAFRHTYCAARLQTLDRGYPVSMYTVAKELGHGGDTLVKRVYGHLGDIRHRSEVVEFRPTIIRRIPNAVVRKAFAERLRKVRKLQVA
jgi:integrase